MTASAIGLIHLRRHRESAKARKARHTTGGARPLALLLFFLLTSPSWAHAKSQKKPNGAAPKTRVSDKTVGETSSSQTKSAGESTNDKTAVPDNRPVSAESENKSSYFNEATIEYDATVPDSSGSPLLNVVDALNESLIFSPRAAAIRALFGISQSAYAAATQMPNPCFFYDRGMVAEQENRIGPILTSEPPWKLMFRLLVQKKMIDQNRFDLMNQLWQFRADVRNAYAEVVIAQETLYTLKELYDLSSKVEMAVSKRFKAGAVPELDVMKARLATSQSAVDRIVGAQRVLKARQNLNIIMGRKFDSPINVPCLPDYTAGNVKQSPVISESGLLPDFSSPVLPLTTFLKLAENNRLELKSLQQQISLNATQLKQSYWNICPNPSLAFGKSVQGNVPTGPKTTAVFFTLNAPTPFTNTNQGDIARYKATGRQLIYQSVSQKNQIYSEVTDAYQKLLASREKLRAYQEHILSDSFQVARLSRRSYEVGQSDITSTLTAQQANVQTISEYLDAVTTYQQSFVNLEQSCGIPLQ